MLSSRRSPRHAPSRPRDVVVPCHTAGYGTAVPRPRATQSFCALVSGSSGTAVGLRRLGPFGVDGDVRVERREGRALGVVLSSTAPDGKSSEHVQCDLIIIPVRQFAPKASAAGLWGLPRRQGRLGEREGGMRARRVEGVRRAEECSVQFAQSQ